MPDSESIQFLELCRLALKGEAEPLELNSAIATARSDLKNLKEEFLAHAAGQSGNEHSLKREVEDVLAGVQSYADGIATIETYLRSRDKNILARGVEQVRQAIERVELALQRYQVAALALHGPTDIPAYNFVASAVDGYLAKKISQKEFIALTNRLDESVMKSMGSFQANAHLPEVQKLIEAYHAHQAALQSIRKSLSNQDELTKALGEFKKSCELIRDRQAPAQVKIFSEKPTPSKASNFMINVTKELTNGTLHPNYFREALKVLRSEENLFRRQLAQFETTSSDKVKIRQGEKALESYSEALARFNKFEKSSDNSLLPLASVLLEKAVFQLYKILKPSQNTP